MPPMKREDHESLLNELLNAEIEHSRRTEILQTLRTDYSTVLVDFEGLNKERDNLQKKHDDLIVSNSQLFRKLGTIEQSQEQQQDQQHQEKSKTITIEDLERGAR